jgi:DNA/RNA-binding domain of Phe-tRNA-synthetase-like protein
VPLWIDPAWRSSVRSVLKAGGFSPTGRNRPASELLVNMLHEQREFAHISNAVDVNNYMSISCRFPISLLDAQKLNSVLHLRYGRSGESYVFNQSGHSLDVKNCIVIAGADDVPLGSPIKDSMAGKVFAGCSSLLALIYADSRLVSDDELRHILQDFAVLLARETGGTQELCEVLRHQS